ncbi:phosphatidate cytidylyltransferase [Amphritea balenae]|uniref:Phosphatidate cytidylyltransferase n=1 Tax=Amphritea balenae TaxID=452629 RepID=A0A3P1SNV8_9GAMM|nr:phosphatidate cytidylyltransferase [Amphritea balenae]RRC98644.1 phosphatidate cytidylyltransferase [Amphritea balenae]GGK66210.1 phosphatidate cytidylyltransferase [Amphritea balenae]
MLKQRVWTAVVLAPLVLVGLFLTGFELFKLFVALIILLGAWEWANLSGIVTPSGRMGYTAFIAALIAGVNYFAPAADFQSFMVIAALFWLLALYWVVMYPGAGGWRSVWQRAFIGVIVLLPSWMALVSLRLNAEGSVFLLMLLLLVWGADIGAYFAGKTWGKAKLAPNVSPGKTRAGLWGGLATCGLISIGFIIYLELDLSVGVYLLLLAMIAGVASVLGDLFESMLKRHRGIKDSSQLLPGHGGVLDRIDSITSAAPVFVLGLQLLAIA